MDAQEKFHSQLIITVTEESSNLNGYVVIDSTIRGKAVGGVRMLPDVSLEEIQELARTMTLKYGFSGIRQGGAKAGIVADPEMPATEKALMLANFARALQPILKTRYAEPLALERFFAMKEKAERPDLGHRVLRAGAALYRSGLVPQFLVRSLSPRYFAAVSKS